MMIHTIGDMIRRNALLRGNETALVFQGRRYTHAQHAERVRRLANALFTRGLRRGERIAVLARNCNEYLEAFGASEMTGFVTVNLNSRLSAAELLDISRDCEPSALIYDPEFAEAARSLAELPSVRIALSLGEVYEAALAEADPGEPPLRARPDDLVYLVYTSGSTGRPKGVMWRHDAVIGSAYTQALEGSRTASDTMLVVMPLFHVGGLIMRLSCVLVGGKIVLHQAFEAESAIDALASEKVTVALFAPIMLQRILDSARLDAADVSSLRRVAYSSAPMPGPLLRRAIARLGPIFYQVYGLTECLGGTVFHPWDHRPDGTEAQRRRLGSAGQAMHGTTLRVVRPDGADCQPEEIGEVLIGTRAMMAGYWNNTAATIEAVRDGFMHTGDLGMLDEDGFLFIMDRKKDMIISGGENIYSWEVEEALRAHPTVLEVAVIGVPDEQWGEAVKACVVLRPDVSASAEELIEHCRASIASYKKPRSVDFIEALPRLFNGKVDKKSMRAPYWRSARQV